MNNKVINIVKIMAILMGLFVCGSISAQNGNVREETARQVGLNFLRLKDKNPRSDLQLTRVDAVQYPNLYVYNTSENGFIVVASDNRIEPILAYSDEGTFDKDNVAPGANFWFEVYEDVIDYIVRNDVREVNEQITQKWEDLYNGIMPEKSRDAIYPQTCRPLIQTHWGQGTHQGSFEESFWHDKYNRFCPWYYKNGKKYRTATGCVATALGQLLNYLQATPRVSTMHYAFTHNVDSEHPNEFSNLHLRNLNGVEITSTSYFCNTLNNIRRYYSWGDWNISDSFERAAKIMYDCGLAVDMSYGYSSSASMLASSCPNRSSAEKALKDYFGYNAYGLLKKDFSDDQWRDTLKKYISQGKPLLYRGDSTQHGESESHTFICDGYDEWNCFHFNFGDENNNDAYYWICGSALNHLPLDYNRKQACLIVKPIPYNEIEETEIHDTIMFYESLARNWNNNIILVQYNPNFPIIQDHTGGIFQINYNAPGHYELDPIIDNDTQLNYSVDVLPIDIDLEIYDSETICRRAGYYGIFGQGDDVVTVSLSRDETDFDGSQTFYRYIQNSVTGTITGVLSLTITTEGMVSEYTLPPVTVNRCDIINEDNCYHWNIGDESYCCGHSGIYEKVFDREDECDSVVYLDLTIIEPENSVYEDTLFCFYQLCQPFIYHGIEITTSGVYYACENDVLYTMDVGLIDTIRKREDISVCTDEVPYIWHGHTLPWTTPGSYDTIFNGTLWECQCDTVYYIYLTIADCCEPPLDCLEDKVNEGNKSTPSNMEVIYYGLKHYYDYRSAMNGFLVNVLQGVTWHSIEDRNTFWNLFQSLLDSNTGMMSESAMQQLIVTNPYNYITEDYITNLVERYNRSVMYWNEGQYSVWYLPQGYNPDFIEYDTAAMNKAYEAYDYAIAHGFNDVKAMYDNAYELLAAEVDNIQSAVCAHVTVKFTQKMTMTREAFNGTLQIFNGHESIPMQDIMVDFRVTDPQGNDCTNLFQIDSLSLDQITGISGNGSLAAQTNGTALVQFIPTKNAAPTQPVVYSFGGSFSFIDPFTGEGLTYPLYPVEITVNPSPDLYVDYFMQRDILGDDALTTNVVEPSIPAELGVIINNKGAGIAKNVILETAEPEIIDNEHGLAIDFAMYGASFNGSPRQLGLMQIPFGNIGSGQTAVGEWLFTSSLLGHFVSYNAHVIHNSSYGNPDLSLVSHLDIHELIHPIYAYGSLDDGINDFLVNDNPDAYDTPDSIYFSHGGRTAVGIVDTISFDHYVEPQDTIVILTINPSRIGWNYGVTEDPGRGNYDLVSCTRDFDGQVIPLNNVWQTFVTIPDGGDPVYENKLHIVDTLSNDVQDFTYTLVYSMKNNLLDVLEITGIPENSINYPLENFTVIFNKAIIDSTFTYEDMTLKCQNGPNLMDSTILITKINDSIYDVNISGLTNETGLYVLNVSTLNIKDSRGYYGYKGKQATWVQVIEDNTQTMNFAQGWNWWSTYIEQEGIDGLGLLEEGLGDNGITIYSQANGYTDYYENYGWWGSLSSIDNISSYKIKTSTPCSVSLTGIVAVPSQHPITLGQGWSWIGYVPSMAMDVNDALSGLEAIAGDMLKSQEGYSEFYADYGWYGSLSTIESGMGLMYYSSNGDPVTFTYPNNGRGEEMKANLTSKHNHWKPNVYAYPDNMTVMAVVELGDTELSSDNYELAAFATNGECRGSVRLIFAEPLHRHVAFLTVSGEDAAELSFRLYDAETGMEYYEAEESLSFVANAIVGHANELYVVHFRGTMEVNELANKVQVYPNPVNRGERFSINIANDVKSPVSVEIINALGVETLRATSVHTITAPNVPGVYTLRITVEGKGTIIRKLVVR